MGRIWGAVALVALAALPLHAGLYDPRNPTSPLVASSGVRPLYFEQLRDELNSLLSIADPLRPKGPRAAMLKRRDELRSQRNLTPAAAAELGLVLWRLRESDAALTTLREAYNRDPRNFWVLSNLGSVYQATGQYREASSPLETARDFVPDPWPNGPAVGDWFKKVEGYQLKLLRLRIGERSLHPTGRPPPAADVDNLFGIHFVGPSGVYTPGRIADAEKAKLPPDAIAIVQQLLLWFPEDTRLLWQLAELYNAEGNLEAATKLLDMCVWQRRFESPALREHRRVVQETYEAQLNTAEPAPPETTKPKILPGTWQVWAVGTACGLVVAALAFFQVRELLRRLRGRTPPV
jgi:tetratricopeptide (TPR) repeat protein